MYKTLKTVEVFVEKKIQVGFLEEGVHVEVIEIQEDHWGFVTQPESGWIELRDKDGNAKLVFISSVTLNWNYSGRP